MDNSKNSHNAISENKENLMEIETLKIGQLKDDRKYV